MTSGVPSTQVWKDWEAQIRMEFSNLTISPLALTISAEDDF